MFLISDAHAQTAAPAADAGGMTSMLGNMLPLLAIFVVFFLFMIRPQMKRQKEMKAMMEALAKGDEVVVASGLMGKITELSDSAISLQIANGVEVQVQRNAVAQVLPKGTLKFRE